MKGAPATAGIHHFSPTVSDVEVSAAWYTEVFGLERLPDASSAPRRRRGWARRSTC
jgi:hypothetical protein